MEQRVNIICPRGCGCSVEMVKFNDEEIDKNKVYCANECGKCKPLDDVDKMLIELDILTKEGLEMGHIQLAEVYAVAMHSWNEAMDREDVLMLRLDEAEQMIADLREALGKGAN